ncbi:MAG: hypothetical protein RR273_01725, partial [Oscillospiraceae bacterium]
GQHDSQSLLNPSKHIDILDSFGVNNAIVQSYTELFCRYSGLNSEIKKLTQLDKSKKEDIELMQFQVQEIEDADLSQEEEEGLQEQKKLIKNAEKIITSLSTAYELLSGTDDFLGACDGLQQAANNISEIQSYTQNMADLSEKISEAAIISQDIMFEVRNYIDDFDVDVSQIDEIEGRLDLYYRLKRKYGNSVEQILETYEKAKEKLNNIEFYEEKLNALQMEMKAVKAKLTVAAQKLTEERIKKFEDMAGKIQKSLEFLNMPNVKLYLNIQDKDFSQDGKDSIEFTIIT